jgi:hypothetical protein
MGAKTAGIKANQGKSRQIKPNQGKSRQKKNIELLDIHLIAAREAV